MRKVLEIEMDLFAGGGGTSCGTRKATGRSPRYALNHNAQAIEMHRANHPDTEHLLEDIWRRNPKAICQGASIGLATFSPDCRHFSLARGGRPTSPRVRALAWSVVWYAKNVQPRIFMVENVKEFLSWGPMVHAKNAAGNPLYVVTPSQDLKGTPLMRAYKRQARGRGITKSAFDRMKGRFRHGHLAKIEPAMVPDAKRKGQTFRAWTRALKREGYVLEWRVLDAADYGVPTHRKRLFVIGRRDGMPIQWPEQTHASPAMIRERPLIFGGMKPYRTAADQPLPTQTTGNHQYLSEAAVNVVKFRGDSPGSDANEPCPTITSGQGSTRPAGAAHALGTAAVFLARMSRGDDANLGVDVPLGVVTTQGNKFALVYAWLMKYHGTSVGSPLDEPIHTVDGNDRYALVKVYVETAPGVREPAIMINVPGIGPCLVSDVHLRMLTPRELARCQSFPDSYILTGSKSSQVARIGNSVPPELVERLVKANYKPVGGPRVPRVKRKPA